MTSKTSIARGQALAAAIYVAGLAYWIFFFNAGRFTLNNKDWYKEAHYLDTLSEALLSGRLPFAWNEPWYHETVRFLAIPEIVLTPDIVLLALLDNGLFTLIHTALLYSLGFAGMLGLARRMELGWLAVGFFWIVCNLNGHLASHLGIGHFQWTGLLLFPLVMHLGLRCLSSPPPSIGAGPIDAPAMLALVVGLLFLNGSFHIGIWCIAVILITCCADWHGLRHAAWAVAMGLILSLRPASRYSAVIRASAFFSTPCCMRVATTTRRSGSSIGGNTTSILAMSARRRSRVLQPWRFSTRSGACQSRRLPQPQSLPCWLSVRSTCGSSACRCL